MAGNPLSLDNARAIVREHISEPTTETISEFSEATFNLWAIYARRSRGYEEPVNRAGSAAFVPLMHELREEAPEFYDELCTAFRPSPTIIAIDAMDTRPEADQWAFWYVESGRKTRDKIRRELGASLSAAVRVLHADAEKWWNLAFRRADEGITTTVRSIFRRHGYDSPELLDAPLPALRDAQDEIEQAGRKAAGAATIPVYTKGRVLWQATGRAATDPEQGEEKRDALKELNGASPRRRSLFVEIDEAEVIDFLCTPGWRTDTIPTGEPDGRRAEGLADVAKIRTLITERAKPYSLEVLSRMANMKRRPRNDEAAIRGCLVRIVGEFVAERVNVQALAAALDCNPSTIYRLAKRHNAVSATKPPKGGGHAIGARRPA